MIEILADSSRGRYIPQHFAEACDMEAWGVKPEDAAILLAGPDHEWYWATWDDVLQYSTFADAEGNVWCLYQDGDLFAIRDDHEFEDWFED